MSACGAVDVEFRKKDLTIVVVLQYNTHAMRRKRKRPGRPPKPKGTALIEHVTVRITESERKQLKVLAKEAGISVSALLMKPFREGEA